MPITFWRDHSEEAVSPADLDSLREKYIDDGRKAAEGFTKDSDTVAVWLSGPFGYSRVQPESDLHIGVLLREARGTFYRHELAPFSGVGRRLEVAFFPLDYFRSALERGYSRWAALFDLHKLREVIILFDRDGILARMTEWPEPVKPARLLVGSQIGALRSEFIQAERFMNGARYADSVMSSREILKLSLMLLLPAGKGVVFSKSSHLYTGLKSRFPASVAEEFEIALSIKGFDEREAERRIEKTKVLVKSLFERQGVCGKGSS